MSIALRGSTHRIADLSNLVLILVAKALSLVQFLLGFVMDLGLCVEPRGQYFDCLESSRTLTQILS